MVRGAWQATIHGVARVGHDLATKPPPPNTEQTDFHPTAAVSLKQETRLSNKGLEQSGDDNNKIFKFYDTTTSFLGKLAT